LGVVKDVSSKLHHLAKLVVRDFVLGGRLEGGLDIAFFGRRRFRLRRRRRYGHWRDLLMRNIVAYEGSQPQKQQPACPSAEIALTFRHGLATCCGGAGKLAK
jgi:hypothetical protein